jgi:hypothetical protein
MFASFVSEVKRLLGATNQWGGSPTAAQTIQQNEPAKQDNKTRLRSISLVR